MRYSNNVLDGFLMTNVFASSAAEPRMTQMSSLAAPGTLPAIGGACLAGEFVKLIGVTVEVGASLLVDAT